KARILEGKEPVETWLKMRAIMRRVYAPRQYHKEALRQQFETKLYSPSSVQKQHDSLRSRASSDIGSSIRKPACYSQETMVAKPYREDKQVCYRKEKTVLKSSMGVQPFFLSETKKKKRFPEEAITVISDLKMAETAPAVTIQEMKTEPSFLLNQDTQSNLKTAISDYCTDVFSSLEGKQMAIEVHEDLKEKRGANTYEGKEAPICVPWLIDQGETNLMGNYESFFHSNNSDSVENTQTCDKLTFLEPVQPSSHSSLSQVVERVSPEKEPEDTTQREQQNILQSETTHQSISNDLQEHC